MLIFITKKMKNEKLNIVFMSVILFLSSCASTPKITDCPENRIDGNLELNTSFDEIAPTQLGENLLYQTSFGGDDSSELTKLRLGSGKVYMPMPEDSYFIDFLESQSTPSFANENGKTIGYFSANYPEGGDDSDLYSMTIENSVLVETGFVDIILNSNANERNPVISPDGSILVFESDRILETGEDLGEEVDEEEINYDLYFSIRSGDSSWSEPKNLGNEINTAFDEIFPSFDSEGDLYFSSNGHTDYDNFDILRAKFDEKEKKWTSVKLFSEPINTMADEKSCFVQGAEITFASNRAGGCGGFDLYKFEFCNPVVLDVHFISETGQYAGDLELWSEEGDKVENIRINNSEKQTFNIGAGRDYVLKFKSDCSAAVIKDQSFYAPCSDSTVIRLVTSFYIPEEINEFSFDQYSMPFFVSGYFRPNTTENLEKLRLKFQYNLIGNSDSTSFVEYPEKKYDDFALQVDDAMMKISEFLQNKIQKMQSECSSESEKLSIEVQGFTDSRPLAKKAVYFGPDVINPDMGIHILNGERLTNENLSILRAYFTVKYLEKKISERVDYSKIKDKIIWTAIGNGIDKSKNVGNDFKRRVKISIEYLNNSDINHLYK
jgi:WD40-like Beta Propeller Repeat